MSDIKRNYNSELYELLSACVDIKDTYRKTARQGEGLYKKFLLSPNYFEGGSANKISNLSKQDQEAVDLISEFKKKKKSL